MDSIDDVAGLVSIGQLAKAAGLRLGEVKPLAGWPPAGPAGSVRRA
jgi:hypothetical protein